MARIIINKGFISQGGRLYKAGEIVDIADADYAKRIVARSGGDFDFYHGQDIPAEEAPASDQAAGTEDKDGVSDSDNAAEADGGGGLPAIDADADVQTAKARGKKK